MSKFNGHGSIVFVNPDTDYFNNYGGNASPDFIDRVHPPKTYDLVHIHFSFDRMTVPELEKLLGYFDRFKKPIIWTCHSLESQREKNIGNGQLQELLFHRAKSVITLTDSCKDTLKKRFDTAKDIEVIPHGYNVDPSKIHDFYGDLKIKRKTNFIYLVGEMRKNKEINESIMAFSKDPRLSDCSLTVLFKPIPTNNTEPRISKFVKIIEESSRVKPVRESEFSNNFLGHIFCKSHVCFLPYLWGTHSGQVELCRDCGCYPVISNVGFYKEQWDKVVEFDYNDDLNIFSKNFIDAVVWARSLPILSVNPKSRVTEFNEIIRKHEQVYKNALASNF